jgi:hypothetical protein
MKSIFVFLFLFGLYPTAGLSQVNVKNLDRSVVLIVGVSNGKAISSGSGFVISNEVVVTNYHVGGNNELVVLTPGIKGTAKAFNAKKIWGSKDYDIQFLRVANLPSPPLPISSNNLKKGQEVLAIGFPAVADEEIVSHDAIESTVSKGIVGRILDGSWYQNKQQFSLIQHNATINKGNSGGPLLDLCGRVVGVNTRKAFSEIVVTKGGDAITSQTEGIFFASGGKILTELLSSNNLTFTNKLSECEFSDSRSKTKSDYLGFLGILLALLMGGAAIFFSLRKTQVVAETYTQFKRRNTSNSPSVSDKNRLAFLLNGIDSAGRNIRIRLDERFSVGSEITIGRDAASRISLDDPTLSRSHAIIKICDGYIDICDLDSTNGTFLNGTKVGSSFTRVQIGQTVSFGKVQLILSREY